MEDKLKIEYLTEKPLCHTCILTSSGKTTLSPHLKRMLNEIRLF